MCSYGLVGLGPRWGTEAEVTMADLAHSRSWRGRWPALALLSLFVLLTWWPPFTSTDSNLMWLLTPFLAGILAAWWVREGGTLGKVLLTCAGAGLLIGLINVAFALMILPLYYEVPAWDLPPIDWGAFVSFYSLTHAIPATIGGATFLGMARLVRGHK